MQTSCKIIINSSSRYDDSETELSFQITTSDEPSKYEILKQIKKIVNDLRIEDLSMNSIL